MTGGAATASLDVIIDPSGAQAGTTVVKRSLEDIKATSRQMTSDITKNFKSLKNIFTTLISGYALKQIAGSFISAAESAENYRTSIRAVSASILEADQTFDRIRKWAAVNPINTDEAVGAFVRLRTAAVDNAEDALKAVADLSTVMQQDMRNVAGAVVTTEVETLRNLGIILDRTGKQATIQFGNVRKTVEKDIASIRKGIIEVIQEAVGGSMQKAADNYRGVLDTMSGMWTDFQQDVMGEGKNSGPFEALKTTLHEVRDEWEAFTKSQDYKVLVREIQDTLVSGIELARDGIVKLGDAFLIAKDNADVLKSIVAALVAYKITLGLADLINNLREAIALARVLTALQAVTPTGLIAGALGTIAGIAVYSKTKKDMKELQEQTIKTESAIASLNEQLKNASQEQVAGAIDDVTEGIKRTEDEISSLKSRLSSLSSGFQSETTMLGKRAIGHEIKAIEDEIIAAQKMLDVQQKSKEHLQGMLKGARGNTASSSSGTGAKSSSTSTSTKSAAELLVEKIRDEMKYLGKDGTSFLGVLDQWQNKLKPLSEDWKKITDLKFDILGDNAQKAAEKADLVLEKIQKQKDEAKELAEMYARADSEYLSSLGWENEQGFLSNEQYFQKLKAQVDELGLATKNVFNWTDYEKSLYSALQSAGLEGFTSELEQVNKKYEDGKIKLDEYTASVESLVTKWGSVPLVSNAGAEAMKNATNQMKTGFYDLNELTTQWIKDFQDGIADAIVEGQNFGDTLTDIGKEIEKLALKSILFGNNGTGGLFGGAFSWLTGLFSAKGNVFGSTGRLTAFAKGGVPSLSDYANTVHASPRVFGFAHGLGVFGEAGPEAVMPLDRNSRGELGVKVVGGYGNYGGNATAAASAPVTFTSQVVVNVNNTGSGEMSNEQAQQIGKAIDNAVEVKVAETMYKFNRMGAFNKRAFAR